MTAVRIVWDSRPLLALQIEAVERARDEVGAIALACGMTPDERGVLRRRLEAAIETLRTLDFGATIAR